MEHKPEPKVLFKGIVHLIMKIQALFTPLRVIPDLYDLFFPCKTKYILRKVSVVFCPYNGSQWAPILFGFQHSSKNIFFSVPLKMSFFIIIILKNFFFYVLCYLDRHYIVSNLLI